MTRFIGEASGQFPYSTIAYVEVEFPDGTRASGTGTLVGRNDILTSAHVVYDADLGGAAESVQVMLGRDGSFLPYGTLDGELLNYFALEPGVSGSLSQSESEDDLALIGLDQAIGDQLGWFGLGSYALGQNYRVTGYPGAFRDASGPRLVEDTGFASANPDFDLVDLNGFDISPGSSGGPVWYGTSSSPILVGAVSTSGWAAAVDAELLTLQNWISGNDYLLAAPDPEERLLEEVVMRLEDEGWSVPAGFETDVLTTDVLLTFPDLEGAIDPVLRLYTGMLGRQPDLSGVEYWVAELNEGGSIQDLASSFAASNEFQALTAQLGGGLEGAIEALYLNVLDRPSDPQGFEYWRDALENGNLDLADVVVSFTNSAEYIAASEPLVQSAKWLLWGVNLQSLDAAELGFDVAAFAAERYEAETIVRLYTSMLDREPDEQGFDYWLDEAGEMLSLPAIAVGFLDSDEFWASRQDASDGALVDFLYREVLDRTPDAPGRNYWLSELASEGFGPGELVLSFVNSAEYVASTAPQVGAYLLENYDGGLVGMPVDAESYLMG